MVELAAVVFYAAVVGAPLVGGLTEVRLRWVLAAAAALAAVLVAGVLWDVAWADESEFYDIGREGALVFGLMSAAFGFALIAAGSGIGRVVRRAVCARRRETVAE
jgi:hypothetical protein